MFFFLAVFSIFLFSDFRPSLFLISSGMIVDGMADKEKLVGRGGRRKRAMRGGKKASRTLEEGEG